MKKNFISVIIIFSLLILSGCSSDNQTENNGTINNSITNETPSTKPTTEPANIETNSETAQTSSDNSEDLEEIFPEYMKIMDSIAGDLIVSLEDLERKDQYYFEKNPEEGIQVFNNILNDFKGYKSELQNLEYNNNPDINNVTNLFIAGLDENIKIIEISIDALKKEEYDQDNFNKLLEESAKKFEVFGEAYRELADKAGYDPNN